MTNCALRRDSFTKHLERRERTDKRTDGWTYGMHAVPFIPAIPFKLVERDRFYDDAERFTRIPPLHPFPRVIIQIRKLRCPVGTRWPPVHCTKIHFAHEFAIALD